jgi:hypothetical protein
MRTCEAVQDSAAHTRVSICSFASFRSMQARMQRSMVLPHPSRRLQARAPHRCALEAAHQSPHTAAVAQTTAAPPCMQATTKHSCGASRHPCIHHNIQQRQTKTADAQRASMYATQDATCTQHASNTRCKASVHPTQDATSVASVHPTQDATSCLSLLHLVLQGIRASNTRCNKDKQDRHAKRHRAQRSTPRIITPNSALALAIASITYPHPTASLHMHDRPTYTSSRPTPRLSPSPAPPTPARDIAHAGDTRETSWRSAAVC